MARAIVERVRELVESWPFWAVYLFFFGGAMVRSHVTYAVGRGLRAGAGRSGSRRPAPGRLGRRLDGPALRRAETAMARFGAPLVTLSFLTVGVQTLLNAAAGGLRMPLRRYTPAAIVGSLLWAGLYTTAGFAILEAIRGALPWWSLVGAVVAGAAVLLVTTVVRTRLDDSETGS